MPLPFSLFLALKYLKPKRTFLSVVSVFSVMGVLIGVMVLLVVISVMSGFDRMWEHKILGFSAHILVSGYEQIEQPEELVEKIEAQDGVKAASPFVQGLVFIHHRNRVYTPLIKGVDPFREKRVSQVHTNMVSGSFSLNEEEVIMGQDLARQMGVRVGDEILVYSPQNFSSPDEMRLPEELTVSGIYELGMWDFDMGYIMTSLDIARDLYSLDGGVHGIQVMVDNPLQVGPTAARISAAIGPLYNVKTWMELNRTLFAALRVEKNLMYFLLVFIVVVAAFGITNTLITSTYQKTREIGLLKAIGFSSGQVMRVFFWQGFTVGLFGTAFGILAGLGILKYRNEALRFMSDHFGLELLPPSLYKLSEIPAHTSMLDLGLIILLSMLICTLAGLIPAWRAARLDPIRALRYE